MTLDDLHIAITNCECCFRARPLQDHHVAMGFRFKAVDDPELILRICEDCHKLIHRMPGDDARAMGLALLRHGQRGNLEHFYAVTNRRWPEASLVSHWEDRLGLKHRRAK